MAEGMVSDYIHSGAFYDRMNDQYTGDLAYYTKVCLQAQGPVLELCCGTGRLTLPIFEAGVDITGVDLSSSMLEAARKKASVREFSIPFLQQDILQLELAQRYALVMIPFNSLQCLYTNEEVEHLLANVKKHLLPGGKLVFDVYNPSIELMVARSKTPFDVASFTNEDGTSTHITETCRYDAATEINHALWHITTGDHTEAHELDTRCFFPLELNLLLRVCGYTLEEKLGSFDGSPFGSGSMKQICTCSIA